MKPLVCVYCEGNDIRIAVVSKQKEEIKVERLITADLLQDSQSTVEINNIGMNDLTEDIALDDLGESLNNNDASSSNSIGDVANSLSDFKLKKADFVPVLSEPAINYHFYESSPDKDKNKLLDVLIEDIHKSKNIIVKKDSIDYIELNGDLVLAAFVEGNLQCVSLIDSLAQFDKKRFYKISAIKSAEISLSHYVSQNTKLYAEDFSLIVYTGSESSKLIFLEGEKIKHIGSALDIGTQNLSTYDVYFSKILLEMENGGIPRLNNVILCGQDVSEKFTLSFYASFPEANVSVLNFAPFNLDDLDEESKEKINLFTIPLAAALEKLKYENKEYSGINILPKYILERQKFLQFGWHSFAMLPILFGVTLYFTLAVLNNYQQINNLNTQINRLTLLRQKNTAITQQINPLVQRVNNFGKTQAILDSVTVNTGLWSNTIEDLSGFIERRRTLWIKSIASVNNGLEIDGFSLSRIALTQLADSHKHSILRNILYNSLRDRTVYTYKLNFMLDNKLSHNKTEKRK